MHGCANCSKPIEDYVNYCDWECMIKLAEKNGGQTIAPNDLPIKCIKADGTMLEDPHADHPSYMFPVGVEYIGPVINLPEWDHSYEQQTHALIFKDEYVALTIYEYRYYLWYLNDGKSKSEPEWKLTQESLNKIKNHDAIQT